jgi:7-cyano-7-deazaguanine synthase in queuosine biosynthesis
MILCDVEFELPKGPVGVLCSGGADSSIVLYLLAKYGNQPIHVFTLANTEKQLANLPVIANVLQWIIKHTSKTDIFHHTYFHTTQTQTELAKYPLLFLQEKKINSLYIGDTCYPPDDVNKSFTESDFQQSTDRSYGVKRQTKHGSFYYPFTNYTKQKIAEVYQTEKVLDLFDLTRSCESPESPSTHCGVCWWCNERKWAFGRL